MVTDGRLGEVEGVVEVADASFTVSVRGDQRQQPQPHRVSESLDERNDAVGLLSAEWVAREWRAAGNCLDRGEFQQ